MLSAKECLRLRIYQILNTNDIIATDKLVNNFLEAFEEYIKDPESYSKNEKEIMEQYENDLQKTPKV